MKLLPADMFAHHKPAANEPRVITINRGHVHLNCKGNYTSTTKYNVVTYLPKALFEQFRSVPSLLLLLLLLLLLVAKLPYCHADASFAFAFISITLLPLTYRRVANTYFALVAGLSCLSISPVA